MKDIAAKRDGVDGGLSHDRSLLPPNKEAVEAIKAEKRA